MFYLQSAGKNETQNTNSAGKNETQNTNKVNEAKFNAAEAKVNL